MRLTILGSMDCALAACQGRCSAPSLTEDACGERRRWGEDRLPGQGQHSSHMRIPFSANTEGFWECAHGSRGPSGACGGRHTLESSWLLKDWYLRVVPVWASSTRTQRLSLGEMWPGDVLHTAEVQRLSLENLTAAHDGPNARGCLRGAHSFCYKLGLL